jgi:hypothetical protein
VWSEGEVIVRREILNDGRCWLEVPVVVVADTADVLATYIPTGSPFTFPPGDWPIAGGRHPWAGRRCWTGHGALMLQRPGDAHAIWVFWDGPYRELGCWYVNLQDPFRRTPHGYDTQDHELDLILHPDGRVERKDEELLDVRVEEGRFTEDQARAFRREADRLERKLRLGERWWDPWWALWEPDPAWAAWARAA